MNLIIRADSTSQMGGGHVMRCLALAQAWQDVSGYPVFVMDAKSSAAGTRLKSEGIEFVHLSAQPGAIDDAIQTAHLAHERDVTWVVVDGYHFDAAYQKSIKDAGLKLLFVDDYGHAEHYFADILLNQNLHASEALYVNKEPYTCLLLGTRYVLLRKEFLKWQGYRREISNKAKKILVTMGGADPGNETLKVIRALNSLNDPDLEVKIIAGPSNPNKESLINATRHAPCPMLCVENASNMADLMAWADIAVSAGGSTCWELAFMGVPFITCSLAENQRSLTKSLEQKGVCINLGWHEKITIQKISHAMKDLLDKQNKREFFSKRNRTLVDGNGSKRVIKIMSSLKITLRKVQKDDCLVIWKWINDPVSRTASFNTEPIPWEDHQKWFASKLSNDKCVIYIANIFGEVPIGQVRFDIKEDIAAISVNLGIEFRGYGLGSKAIKKACDALFKAKNIRNIHAVIKRQNTVSMRAFENAGFKKAEETIYKKQHALLFILKIMS